MGVANILKKACPKGSLTERESAGSLAFSARSRPTHNIRLCLGWRAAVSRPCFHKLATFLQSIAAAVRRLSLVADRVGESGLSSLARERRLFGGPVAEGRTKAVRGEILVRFMRRSVMSIALVESVSLLPEPGNTQWLWGCAFRISLGPTGL